MVKYFVGLCVATLLTVTRADAAQSIVIASSEGVPYTGRDLRFGGYVNHILKHIYESAGYEVHIEFLNWSRARQLTHEGHYHMASYVYEDPKHTKDFLLSEAVTLEQLVFMHHRSFDMPVWSRLEDLTKIRVGLTRGYTYTGDLWRHAETNSHYISIVNTDKQNIALLMKRRVDIFPVGKLQGAHLLQMETEDVQNSLVFDGRAIGVMTGKVMFPKSRSDATELRDILNTSLDELTSSGELKRFADALARGFYSREQRQHLRQRSGED